METFLAHEPSVAPVIDSSVMIEKIISVNVILVSEQIYINSSYVALQIE